MSGIVNSVKKVFKGVAKVVKGAAKAVAKVVKKVVKSKIFKVVAIGAAIYFGGAALMSMAGGGTASAGIGSAWGGLQGAGTALASGEIGGAASALGSGFTGGGALGATGTFASGQALTTAGITGNSAAIGASAAGYSPELMASTHAATTATPAATAALGNVTAAAATNAPAAAESTGLLSSAWNGLGEAGKAAAITSGVNMGGQMLQGSAEQSATEEERKRRTYWGVDGEGNSSITPNFGLLNPGNLQANNQSSATPKWQTSLDDLIKKQKQIVGG